MFWKPNETTMGCSFAQKTKAFETKASGNTLFFLLHGFSCLSLLGRFIFELHSPLKETNSKSLA